MTMNPRIGVAVLAMTLELSFAAGGEPRAKVVIRVYNYARVERNVLQPAQKLAAEILNHAGVGTEWIQCPVFAEGNGDSEASISDCRAPLGRQHVVLNLLPASMARKIRPTADTFGLAVATAPLGMGMVWILVDRTDDLAVHGPFSVATDIARRLVMGHVAAHEIGHVLLGPGYHSPAGLMAQRWSPTEVKQVASRYLTFTEHEIETIRMRLSESGGTDRSRNALPARRQH